jgi:hypothetical protein
MGRAGPGILALLIAVGCGGPGDSGATCPTRDRGVLADEDSDGNVTLYLSNQDLQAASVDMRLSLDDVPILDAELAVCTQHEIVGYRFRWAAGDHVLHAVSSQGQADARQAFTVGTGDLWIFAWYGYDHAAGHGDFGFRISDEPIYFQ